MSTKIYPQHSKRCLAVLHLFLPVFISLLCMQNLSLKVIADLKYCNLQHCCRTFKGIIESHEISADIVSLITVID